VERMALEADMRPPLSRGMLNRAREEDRVPAVLYGRGKESIRLLVDGRSLRQLFISGGGNVLIDLQIKGMKEKLKPETVMFKEIQRHIIQQDKLMHVDFIRISMTDQIEVHVQLNFVGEPAGVKEGGVLQILARELLVKCLPGDIPDTITVDLSGLTLGDSINAGSIILDQGVELILDPEEPLAQVLAPAVQEEEAKAKEDVAAEPAPGKADSAGD